MSFTEFIARNRIRKASVLLEKSDINLEEISHLVGFSSTWYFKKVFEKYYGMSVEVYIETHAKALDEQHKISTPNQ